MKVSAITRLVNSLMGGAGIGCRKTPWNEKIGPKIERKPDSPALREKSATDRRKKCVSTPFIRILEEKGLLRHEADGPRHVYHPTLAPEQARISALDHLLQTHFRGSVSQAIAALLESSADSLTEGELKRITDLIEEARKEGR